MLVRLNVALFTFHKIYIMKKNSSILTTRYKEMENFWSRALDLVDLFQRFKAIWELLMFLSVQPLAYV